MARLARVVVFDSDEVAIVAAGQPKVIELHEVAFDVSGIRSTIGPTSCLPVSKKPR